MIIAPSIIRSYVIQGILFASVKCCLPVGSVDYEVRCIVVFSKEYLNLVSFLLDPNLVIPLVLLE